MDSEVKDFIDFFIDSYSKYDDNLKKNVLIDLRNKVTKYNLLEEMIEATNYCHEFGHDYSGVITHTYKDYYDKVSDEQIYYCRRCGKIDNSRVLKVKKRGK